MGRVVALAASSVVDAASYSSVDLVADPKPGNPGDDELDYALLRLAEPVGELPVGKGANAEPRGWLALGTTAVDFPSKQVVAILQHPETLPMKLALSTSEVITVTGGGRRIRYTLPTENGSSGSPVFDGDWTVIALHHSGDPRFLNPSYNEAIPIALVAARPKVASALT